MSRKQEGKKNSAVGIFFLGTGMLALAYSLTLEKKTERGQKDLHSISSQESAKKEKKENLSVSRYLQDVERKKHLAREKMKYENEREAPSISPSHVRTAPQVHSSYGVDMEQDDFHEKVSDIVRGQPEYSDSLTPGEEIQMELWNAETQARNEKIKREKFIRGFIENARKDGLRVKLNKNLDVVKANRMDGSKSISSGGTRSPQSTSTGGSSEAQNPR